MLSLRVWCCDGVAGAAQAIVIESGEICFRGDGKNWIASIELE
jgi:hypothetical protein